MSYAKMEYQSYKGGATEIYKLNDLTKK